MSVRIQDAPFDLGHELQAFGHGANTGAIVTFSGIVRDEDGTLQEMVIEHYPAMTKQAIETIEAEAVARWNLLDCLVIHRFGSLKPGDQIMMVATAAGHRAEAFAAAEFLMDYLKSRAPFWKKEVTQTGETWVDAKDADEDALKRW